MRMTENGIIRTKLELAIEYLDKLMELHNPNTVEDLKAIADEVRRNGITLTDEEVRELQDAGYIEEDIEEIRETMKSKVIKYLRD